MLFYIITSLINAISSTVLGLFVYLKDRKKVLNKSFALFCISVAIWSYGYYFWLNADNAESALFWSRALKAGAIFIPIFYFHFTLSFLNKIQEKKKILIFGYLVFIFFFFANFTSFFIKDVAPNLGFSYWPNPGILYHPYLLLWFFYAIYTIYLLSKELSIATGTLKGQIKYILIGTTVGYVGGITNYFLWYDIPIPPIGNGLVVIYVILTALAILKYHLFEIKVILTELLVGVMGIVLVISSFLMPTVGLKILTSFIFLLFCIVGYLLIKATYQEIGKRKKIEKLTLELRKLNEGLEQRVKERTKELEKQKKIAETHYEIAEERMRRLEGVHYSTTEKESEIENLKRKIIELKTELSKNKRNNKK